MSERRDVGRVGQGTRCARWRCARTTAAPRRRSCGRRMMRAREPRRRRRRACREAGGGGERARDVPAVRRERTAVRAVASGVGDGSRTTPWSAARAGDGVSVPETGDVNEEEDGEGEGEDEGEEYEEEDAIPCAKEAVMEGYKSRARVAPWIARARARWDFRRCRASVRFHRHGSVICDRFVRCTRARVTPCTRWIGRPRVICSSRRSESQPTCTTETGA